jgi:hypothetical protein
MVWRRERRCVASRREAAVVAWSSRGETKREESDGVITLRWLGSRLRLERW